MNSERAGSRQPRRLLILLHRWLGLALGALILISAVTGAAIAWRDHAWRWQHPELAAPAPELSDERLAAAVEYLIRRHHSDGLRLLAPPRPGLAGWRLWLGDGEQALYSADGARLLARWQESRSPFGIMLALHEDLLAGTAGRWVMGAVGAGTVVLSILGLLIWLRRPRRPRLKELLPRRAFRGPWLVAHRQWGVLVAVPALIIMVTGTLMAWSTLWRDALPEPERFSAPAPADTPAALTPAIGALRGHWPEAQLSFIDVSQLDQGRLSGRLRQPGELHPNGRSSLTVNLHGAPVERYDALVSGPVAMVDDLVYPLHSGRVDVPGWHLLVVVSGVVLTGLAISGFVTWLAAPGRSRSRSSRAGLRGTTERAHPADPAPLAPRPDVIEETT